jgi:hypothetical protein
MECRRLASRQDHPIGKAGKGHLVRPFWMMRPRAGDEGDDPTNLAQIHPRLLHNPSHHVRIVPLTLRHDLLDQRPVLVAFVSLTWWLKRGSRRFCVNAIMTKKLAILHTANIAIRPCVDNPGPSKPMGGKREAPVHLDRRVPPNRTRLRSRFQAPKRPEIRPIFVGLRSSEAQTP